jgi:hypothetical protein
VQPRPEKGVALGIVAAEEEEFWTQECVSARRRLTVDAGLLLTCACRWQ